MTSLAKCVSIVWRSVLWPYTSVKGQGQDKGRNKGRNRGKERDKGKGRGLPCC